MGAARPRCTAANVANALIHRDYTRLGAVHVQWHDDSIQISNPGGFPEGVRLDNLLVTPPRPRNPLLADVFKRAGIVERTARGIDTIFYEQLRSGRPAPSYERSTETSVVLVLLQYIEKYGRITRQQAAELCRISLYQSTRLLAALVSSGKLERHGTARGTWYSLRS